MSDTGLHGSGVFIADKSAWQRAPDPSVRDDWRRALGLRRIATCAIVKMELLYSTRDARAFDRLDEDLDALRDVPISRTTTQAAIAAMRQLAHRAPLLHRVSIPDALIAAAAQEAGVGVLHYDAHYDRLAEVLEFESRWIAPRGSIG